MINGTDEPPYMICSCCRKAYKGWEADNWMTDGYSDGSEEVDDPPYYIIQEGTEVICPHCGYMDLMYTTHLPVRFHLKCGDRYVTMTREDIENPRPEPKRFSLGDVSKFSLGGQEKFSLPTGKFSLMNRKSDRSRRRIVSNPNKGKRRWS